MERSWCTVTVSAFAAAALFQPVTIYRKKTESGSIRFTSGKLLRLFQCQAAGIYFCFCHIFGRRQVSRIVLGKTETAGIRYLDVLINRKILQDGAGLSQ